MTGDHHWRNTPDPMLKVGDHVMEQPWSGLFEPGLTFEARWVSESVSADTHFVAVRPIGAATTGHTSGLDARRFVKVQKGLLSTKTRPIKVRKVVEVEEQKLAWVALHAPPPHTNRRIVVERRPHNNATVIFGCGGTFAFSATLDDARAFAEKILELCSIEYQAPSEEDVPF